MFDQGTFDAMTRHGGSFVKKLAEAWRLADPENSARLIRAFPEYFEQYRVWADEDRARAMIEKAVAP